METTALLKAAHLARLHIAIDGPAGAGKSTVGLGLSRALRCAYVDTGLMYRSVALSALAAAISPSDAVALERIACSIQFGLNDGDDRTLIIDGAEPDPKLRSPKVDEVVSAVSEHAGVRTALVTVQRRLVADTCAVVVGRDIGTTVLPDAPVKLWVTASAVERSRRRQSERLSGRWPGSAQVTETSIVQRDRLDSRRAVSPLRQAVDAIVIDTGGCTPEESVRQSLQVVARVLHGQKN